MGCLAYFESWTKESSPYLQPELQADRSSLNAKYKYKYQVLNPKTIQSLKDKYQVLNATI